MSALTTLPVLLAISTLVALGSMFWLMIHARAVVALFQKQSNDLAAGPAPGAAARPSRRTVWIMLILFNIAWIISFLIVAVGMKEAAEGPPVEPPGTASQVPRQP